LEELCLKWDQQYQSYYSTKRVTNNVGTFTSLVLLYTRKLNMQDSIFDIFGTQDPSRQSTVKALSKTYVQPLKGRVDINFFGLSYRFLMLQHIIVLIG
jgi:hypothetical protein